MRTIMALVVVGVVGVVGAAVQLTAQRPVTSGRTTCVPFDPATLTIAEVESTGRWRLQRGDGAILKLFVDREDAEAGLAVARAHTQLCYIGKSNTRPDREKYIMEYWK